MSITTELLEEFNIYLHDSEIPKDCKCAKCLKLMVLKEKYSMYEALKYISEQGG